MQATLIPNTNNDLMVANTARVSFDKWNTELDLSFTKSGKQRDPNLIRYLAEHNHLSPFFHIRFTMEFPSTEAIPLYAITDPTYLMGAVWSVTNGRFRFRTSFYGWVRLVKDGMINPDYVDGILAGLTTNPELQYSCAAYSFTAQPESNDNWLFTGVETDPHFIDASVRFNVPIFIARQLFTHRMFASNEVSRRYVNSAPEFYIHPSYRKRPSGSIKQGSSATEFVKELSCYVSEHPNERVFSAIDPTTDVSSVDGLTSVLRNLSATIYSSLIHAQVAPEQARGMLLQDMYTSFIFTGSLVSWSRLIHERTYSGAQLEVQQVANQVYDQLVTTYPFFVELHQATKRK